MTASVSSMWSNCVRILFKFPDTFPIFLTLFQYTRQGVPSLHTCAVRHRLARLCPTQLLPAAALQARLGIRAQSSVLRAWVRHCSTLQVDIARHCSALHAGIAKSWTLTTGCLGLSCALRSVNEHTPVFMWFWGGMEVAWSTCWRVFSFLLKSTFWSNYLLTDISSQWHPININWWLVSNEPVKCLWWLSVQKRPRLACFVCLRRARVFHTVSRQGLANEAFCRQATIRKLLLPRFPNYAGWSLSLSQINATVLLSKREKSQDIQL